MPSSESQKKDHLQTAFEVVIVVGAIGAAIAFPPMAPLAAVAVYFLMR